MEKKEAKKLGAWISLLGGGSFVLAAAAAAYIAFLLPPAATGRALAWMGRTFHRARYVKGVNQLTLN